MTDQTAQEPTMEEILASIRRIISEDDAPAETATTPEPAPAADTPAPVAAEATAETAAPAQAEDDVLELTERAEAPAAETIGDLDVVEAEAEPEPFPAEAAAEPEPEPEPEPVSESAWAPEPAAETQAPAYDSLVGDSAAASAASAFAGLAASFNRPEPTPRGPDINFASGSTVEAMVAEMLRPMLKEWLDANLPGIVEAQVRKEVERIARNAG